MLDSSRSVSFGALLRELRLAAGLTQEALAERAGLGTRSIQQLEAGVGRPRRHTIASLARALALSDEERAGFEAAANGPPRQRTGMAAPAPAPPGWEPLASSVRCSRCTAAN